MQNQPNTNEIASQEIARQLGQTIISNIHMQIALQQLAAENAALKAKEPKPAPVDMSGVSASDIRDLERLSLIHISQGIVR